MDYTRRAGRTARPAVPQGLYNESKKEYLSNEDWSVGNSSRAYENLDQTPSSFLLIGKSTMGASRAFSVPIKGLNDKRCITLNFIIEPMQVMYSEKPKL